MVSFYYYDIPLFILFSAFVAWFLFRHRKNLKREMGVAFLYRTQLGVRTIERFTKKFKFALEKLKWVVITSGFVLMAAIVYLISKSLYIYITVPQIIEVVKAPPLIPLLPYIPELFGLESFFPPLTI